MKTHNSGKLIIMRERPWFVIVPKYESLHFVSIKITFPSKDLQILIGT